MEKYRNKLLPGLVRRQALYKNVFDLLEQTQGQQFDQADPNVGYALGHLFGVQDTLKAVIDMIEAMPEDKPYKEPTIAERLMALSHRPY